MLYTTQSGRYIYSSSPKIEARLAASHRCKLQTLFVSDVYIGARHRGMTEVLQGEPSMCIESIDAMEED